MNFTPQTEVHLLTGVPFNISYNNVLAQGDVYILGEYYYESKINILYESKRYVEDKGMYYIRIGDKKIILYKPFDISGDCDIMKSEKFIER